MITYQDELSKSQKKAIFDGLNNNAFAKRELGQNNASFAYVIEDEKKKLIAGVSGFNFYGCFHIDLLFVKESSRGQGYGGMLMDKSEQLAKERDCLFMTVNTMDFEAKPFYERHGFYVEFVRSGFEKESRMYFLRKEL